MFDKEIKKFLGIDNAHIKKERKQNLLDQLKIEKYKNIY